MKNYINQIEKNYEIVYDHFKEQDQLRNTGFGFFTTLTIAVMGFLDKDRQIISLLVIFGAMFLLGLLFSLLLCRYKYYGNLYSITMKVLRTLYNCNENLSKEKRQEIIKETIKKKISSIKPRLYSADFLIYFCLILINSLNLIMIIDQFKPTMIVYALVIAFYVVVSIIIYDYSVIRKSRQCRPEDLSFIDAFYESDNNPRKK